MDGACDVDGAEVASDELGLLDGAAEVDSDLDSDVGVGCVVGVVRSEVDGVTELVGGLDEGLGDGGWLGGADRLGAELLSDGPGWPPVPTGTFCRRCRA